jgi:hypothetical protein
VIIFVLPLLASCFSNNEVEFKSEAEKLCNCVRSKDSISSLDTLKKIDLSELNYSRCASELAVDPFQNVFKDALKSRCPDLYIRHENYLKQASRNFSQ